MNYLLTSVGKYVASFWGPTWESLEGKPDWEKFMYLCKNTDEQFLNDLSEFSLLTANQIVCDPIKACVGKTPVDKCPKNTKWYIRHEKNQHTIVCGFCRNNLYLDSGKERFEELAITLYSQQECQSYKDNCIVRLFKFKDLMLKIRNEDNASVKLDEYRIEYQNLRGINDESADTLKALIDLMNN